MKSQQAVRNIRLCTKDCLCLYVCPVGATDTETGQIDFEKCIGCGKCATACPSGAISMIPTQLPPQQKKSSNVISELHRLAKSKTEQEAIAMEVYESTDDPIKKKIAKAVIKANRLMAEDLFRESLYMLPQSTNTHKLLANMLINAPSDFPIDAVKQLIKTIKTNDMG